MKHTIIEKAALKAKSEETGIPFSNLLAGYVLEELMYLIEDSPFSLFLWLKNSGALGVEQYQKKNLLTLDFAYVTDPRAMKREKKRAAAELHLHSDQGFQYTSQAYFDLTQEYGITPSMSRRGNPYDNAMAENFFSTLKTECIYRHKPASFREADEMIAAYIHFYNHERIQTKTGVAPLTLRHSA